jgi:hypothetical protein
MLFPSRSAKEIYEAAFREILKNYNPEFVYELWPYLNGKAAVGKQFAPIPIRSKKKKLKKTWAWGRSFKEIKGPVEELLSKS